MLDIENLNVLFEAIKNRVWQELIRANRTDELEQYFSRIGMDDIYIEFIDQDVQDDEGFIAVIGGLNVPKQAVIDEFEKVGYREKHIEMYPDYNKLTNIDFSKFLSPKYEKILVGAMPHSVKGKGDASSGIRMLENTRREDVIRLQDGNGKLKITLNTLKQAIACL